MAITLTDTPASASANAYADAAYALAYFETRAPLSAPWEDNDEETQKRFLIMATRILDASFRGQKQMMSAGGLDKSFYVVRRTWTGLPATATQRLAWPRIGMLDQNGNAILTTVNPTDLKDACCELAGQLSIEDRTLDNDVSVQGIKSVSAGPVSVSFRDGAIVPQVLPDAVINLLIPSWYTDEDISGVVDFEFDTITAAEAT